MSPIRWPDPINEAGRLAEGRRAQANGRSSLGGDAQGCPQILHVSLFFDGTNNNMKWDSTDPEAPTHTNVARLFLTHPRAPSNGLFPYYIPGVGTPFPEIGETEFSALGKALALGFGMRVGWGYAQLLNALHQALAGHVLLDDPDARALCAALDNEVLVTRSLRSPVAAQVAAAMPAAGAATRGAGYVHQHRAQRLLARLHGELAMLQKRHSNPGGQLNRSIQQVWVNVFGFSRGAAGARVFVHRLVNRWAPGGLIAGTIPYRVNFLGLFDTVASVGLPDSATAAIARDDLDGHWLWTANGALDVPPEVRRCVHFFSIHEQRMAFPLDTIREQHDYPGGAPWRIEVAYPGVHSDVGGGYPVFDQGKAREGEGSKLSQIPLHNMYIEALEAGVPLLLQDEISQKDDLVRDFALSPTMASAFNDWLATLNAKPLDSVETALRTGLGQSLAWRTLRAEVGRPAQYLTSQAFYRAAQEDALTPHGLETKIASQAASAGRLDVLKREKGELEARRAVMDGAALNLMGLPTVAAAFRRQATQLEQRIAAKAIEILEAAAGDGKQSRPGEGATELVTNDQTDLLESAEEFQLLLAWLRPTQQVRWQAYWAAPPGDAVQPAAPPYVPSLSMDQKASAYYLSVARADTASHHRQGSRAVWLSGRDRTLQLASLTAPYQPILDFLLAPAPPMLPFLLAHTSDEAVRALPAAAIRLFDDYVHDSRAWFRVPYFHEYAPGGYGWARTFFVGNDERVRHLGLAADFATAAAQRNAQEADSLGRFLAAQAAGMPPANLDFNAILDM